MSRHGRTLALVSCACTLAAGLLAPIGEAIAADKLEDHFTRDWFYTEVVIFQRPQVGDFTSEERLAQPAAPLAHALRSFRTPPERRWSVYRLAPFTRAHLSFPYLDVSRLDWPYDAEAPADPAPVEPAPLPSGVEPPGIEPRLGPDPLLDFLREVAAFETALAEDSYRWLDSSTFTLAPHARALEREAGFQVLLHGRWLQPVPARDAAEPLLIQVGPRYGDTFALQGTLEVTRGRYLHFGAHLLYTEPLLGRSPVNRALPPPREAAITTPSGYPVLALSAEDLDPAGFMQLRENRRVSDEELSYFDHPKLGVLVSIRPVTPPPALVAAHQALEADAAQP